MGAAREVATVRDGQRPEARLVGVTMDEMLAGPVALAEGRPHCGHPPDDFVDEETVVE